MFAVCALGVTRHDAAANVDCACITAHLLAKNQDFGEDALTPSAIHDQPFAFTKRWYRE
jgi:hypothetical protein